MKNFSMAIYAALVLVSLSNHTQAADDQITCKASMMGRICFDASGRELTIAEMQAATSDSQKKDPSEKVAKK